MNNVGSQLPQTLLDDPEYQEGFRLICEGQKKQQNAFYRLQEKEMIDSIIHKLESFKSPYGFGFNMVMLSDCFCPRVAPLFPHEIEKIIGLLKKEIE